AVAMETVHLAPNAQVSLYPWKDTPDKIPLAVRHIRTFLRAYRPVGAAQSMAAAAGFDVFVTNERSGDVTVIDGTSFNVVATIPVGIEHGTVAVPDRSGILHEITTFRRDVNTDGRHAVVEFGASLEEDLEKKFATYYANPMAVVRYLNKRVIVLRRTGKDIPWTEGRDHWWHDQMKGAAAECAPEPMDAEDPLFILYTSGSTGKPKGVLHTTAGPLGYVSPQHEHPAILQRKWRQCQPLERYLSLLLTANR
ncbi:hypothetical protein B4Q13_17200, partial [Lacticaseibacillus rhamnosus]